MPLNRIVNAMNEFIEHAESGQLKEAAKAINEANSAYRQIDQKPEGRKKTKEILGEIYEKLKGGDKGDAIEEAVKFRGNFEGALQMQEQMKSQIQAMKNAGIDPVQMAKNMPVFQTIVGSLCYQNWKPNLPPEINLGCGMLTAFDCGLRGDCGDSSPDETLESVASYENEFYISPLELFSSIPISSANVIFTVLKENHEEMKSTIPFNVFIIDFVQRQINNLLAFSGGKLTGADSICFEGMLAICFELGLRYFVENPEEAEKLAREHRPPTPY